jgi:hypothetical protein
VSPNHDQSGDPDWVFDAYHRQLSDDRAGFSRIIAGLDAPGHDWDNFGVRLISASGFADTLEIIGFIGGAETSSYTYGHVRWEGSTGDYFYGIGILFNEYDELHFRFGEFSQGQTAVFEIFAYKDSAITPEPATLAVLGLGLAGLGVARRRMKK